MEAIRYRPRRLGHVNFFVNDLWQTMDFYKSVLGFDESARETSSGSGFLSNGNTHHDVGVGAIDRFRTYLESRNVPRLPNHMDTAGLYHFGWEMDNESELVDAYKRALASGENPRVTDAATGRSNYVMDPDGFSHQFYVDTETDWRKVYIGGETLLHFNPPWDPLYGEPSQARRYVEHPLITRNQFAPVHQQRVTHGTMVVADIFQSEKFYTQVCGFDVVGRTADGKAVRFGSTASDHVITILCTGEAPRIHHASFLLHADDTVAVTAAALERLRIPVERVLYLDHKHAIFLRDPNGLLLEFYSLTGEHPDWTQLEIRDETIWQL
ncbi:VOC family protein [Blastomonas fulva]|uniref:VOC family protein n=1 Tax=Blastomonas fulva TaxID=1550728 RepID=UPI003F71E165